MTTTTVKPCQNHSSWDQPCPAARIELTTYLWYPGASELWPTWPPGCSHSTCFCWMAGYSHVQVFPNQGVTWHGLRKRWMKKDIPLAKFWWIYQVVGDWWKKETTAMRSTIISHVLNTRFSPSLMNLHTFLHELTTNPVSEKLMSQYLPWFQTFNNMNHEFTIIITS